ncbi:MAG: GTP cyclohydrolase II [Crocinitomicaceae bacterium]|jgi:3,4-dihydroxy 2-butanone 4-phosphate synthase/GTP cyclohydrolase II|nr:GTP cyclohydrolase II [Crocinitomicaceae bacterium]
MSAYGDEKDLFPHVVLHAPVARGVVPLARIHSECMTGDMFHSTRCECGEQLDRSLEEIGKKGGVLIYLRQEGRGIGLVEKLKAYNLQDEGLNTIEANEALGHQSDSRSYEVAARILKDLKIPVIRLMTNNPLKVKALEAFGIEVKERVPLVIEARPENAGYLEVKRAAMGHYLG